MAKTIFIVAGFRHKADEKQYEWMRDFFKSKGYIVKIPDINWSNKVMTDYIDQFTDYYNKNKSDSNAIIGFSYGAMIALISASHTKPDQLILCSLSPYFSEDLGKLKKSWKKSIGRRRADNFKKYKSSEIARIIESRTTIIYGSLEGKRYPQLKKRCVETSIIMPNSELLVAENAPHEIDFPSYVGTIKSIFT